MDDFLNGARLYRYLGALPSDADVEYANELMRGFLRRQAWNAIAPALCSGSGSVMYSRSHEEMTIGDAEWSKIVADVQYVHFRWDDQVGSFALQE
ncbi:MAG TPA: hypothetical protein ENJ09_09775 [Planctomycetes bacterium]|nr:hypothetical protein [Planctomycetota bacterium]